MVDEAAGGPARRCGSCCRRRGAVGPSTCGRRWQRLPRTRLINGYGPTESTTFTCCHPIPAELRRAARRCPSAGRSPTPTSTCSIAGLRAGAGGRAGRAVRRRRRAARGYLNRPELTAERFVPDPFAATGRAAVPHRRPGALAAGRRPRVPGPDRPPGEDARLPDRAGRDRGGALSAPRGARGALVLVREERPSETAGWWRYVVPKRGPRERRRRPPSSGEERVDAVARRSTIGDLRPGRGPRLGADLQPRRLEQHLHAACPFPRRRCGSRSSRPWSGSSPAPAAGARDRLRHGAAARSAGSRIARGTWPRTSPRSALDYIRRAPACDLGAPGRGRAARAAGGRLRRHRAGSFDAVVLNSVVQYFPDVDYLSAGAGRCA